MDNLRDKIINRTDKVLIINDFYSPVIKYCYLTFNKNKYKKIFSY